MVGVNEGNVNGGHGDEGTIASSAGIEEAARVKPVVASFVATFLAPEMLHVYRQVTGLQQFESEVMTLKWRHRERFPFPAERVTVIPRARARFLRRLWFRQMLGGPNRISRGQSGAILESLSRVKASVLHVYFGHIGVMLLPLLRVSPVPVVVSFHGADAGVDLERRRHRKALTDLFEHSDRVLVRSAALGDELIKLGCPESKIRLNRTGIPMGEWPFRERSEPGDGAWRCLQACRLIEKKGLDLSLKAFARFRERYPRAELRIAGEGPLISSLEAQVAELGLGSSVTLLGFLDQASLRREIESAHFFLHPSRTGRDGNREGVPNSMLEAMASGAVVIATEHGGIPEAVTHGESGWLVPEEDWTGLAAALLDLAENWVARGQAMGRAGRAAVESGFAQENQIADLEDVYLNAMSAAGIRERWSRGN